MKARRLINLGPSELWHPCLSLSLPNHRSPENHPAPGPQSLARTLLLHALLPDQWALGLLFYLEPTPTKLLPHHSAQIPLVKVTNGLHVAKSKVSSRPAVSTASDTEDASLCLPHSPRGSQDAAPSWFSAFIPGHASQVPLAPCASPRPESASLCSGPSSSVSSTTLGSKLRVTVLPASPLTRSKAAQRCCAPISGLPLETGLPLPQPPPQSVAALSLQWLRPDTSGSSLTSQLLHQQTLRAPASESIHHLRHVHLGPSRQPLAPGLLQQRPQGSPGPLTPLSPPRIILNLAAKRDCWKTKHRWCHSSAQNPPMTSHVSRENQSPSMTRAGNQDPLPLRPSLPPLQPHSCLATLYLLFLPPGMFHSPMPAPPSGLCSSVTSSVRPPWTPV